MEKQVWKHWLSIRNNQSIMMPIGAEILSCQFQEAPCIWFLCDPKAEQQERFFEVFGTGHPIAYDMGVDRKFIGTCQEPNGLVWHVFERLN